MSLTTFTARAVTALVAAVAGYSSYQHIVAVALHAGEHRGVALALPLSIDGLIVVGTMAMLEDKRANRIPRPAARFALGFGIVATIAANVASAEPTMTARLVAAVPALAFLIAVEVLARSGRARPALEVADPEPAAEPQPEPVQEPAEPVNLHPSPPPASRPNTKAEKVARVHAQHPALSHAQLAARAGVSLSTVKRYRPRSDAVNGRVPDLAEVAR